MNDTIKDIGHISACIANDHRYTDYLKVTFDITTEVVSVTVTETSPIDGMDGQGGVHAPTYHWSRTTVPKPTTKDVMALIKQALNNDNFSFKRYGKPSQRFRFTGQEPGFNATKCKAALNIARSGES